MSTATSGVIVLEVLSESGIEVFLFESVGQTSTNSTPTVQGDSAAAHDDDTDDQEKYAILTDGTGEFIWIAGVSEDGRGCPGKNHREEREGCTSCNSCNCADKDGDLLLGSGVPVKEKVKLMGR